MATSRKNCGFAASIIAALIWMLTSTAQALNDNVAIGNAFHSPTEFTCNSNTAIRRTYTAAAFEIYYFGFDAAAHQYWDCHVYNRGYDKSGTFRFWGDDSHGGPDLWSCSNCKWNVDQFGISLYVDNQWRYKYFWSSKSHRKLLL